MKENPYSKLIEIIKKENNTNRSAIEVGEILSTSPLTLKMGDLQIDRNNILLAENISLVKGSMVAVATSMDRQLYIILARLKEV